MLVRPCCSDRRLRLLPWLAIFLPGATALAQPSSLSGAARWADTARVTIDRAVTAGDTAALAVATALVDRALGAFPADPLLLHYRGYALYRQAQRLAPDAPETEALLTRAISTLQQSAAARPLAETQALLSSVYGSLAGRGMVAGMRYGPKAREAGDAAAALAPRNPRVLLLSAIGAWFTPPMWGGGKDKGYALLQRALSAFASDQPPRPLPSWGHAEALAWLGQMEVARGNVAAARAAYERALALEPGYAWVRQALLPALAAR